MNSNELPHDEPLLCIKKSIRVNSDGKLRCTSSHWLRYDSLLEINQLSAKS